MAVRVRIAQSTEELDQVFRLRHQVFVEEEGYMVPRPDKRITDRFDAYPTTANLVGVVDGRIVGAVRFMEQSAAGVSADEFFDFSPFLPPGARYGCGTMLVVPRQYRGTPRLVVSLMGMGYYWAVGRGLTHMVAAMNPERSEPMLRSGYRVVGPQFHDKEKSLDVLPAIVELAAIADRFRDFVNRQQKAQRLGPFERQFHVEGETVLRKGDPGDAAFVVVHGRAAATLPDGTILNEFYPGAFFGELALIAARPRSDNVVALTDLDLMVLQRDSLLTQVRERPETAEWMLELLRRCSQRAGLGVKVESCRSGLAIELR